jgi:polygalacturonase
MKFVDIDEPIFPDSYFFADKTHTIQETVNQCADAGGGTVIVPKGNWQSGPIHMRSNVHLKFEDGAVIEFSEKFAEYLPVIFTRWEGMECYNYSPLIYANGCSNIAVTGNAELIGNGEAWWHWKKLQQKAAEELCYAEWNQIPPEKRSYGTEEAALRPSFIQTVNCKDVLLDGFTVKNGPQWTLHPVYCENVIIRNINVSTQGPNTDGLNPDSCKNVLIENCAFDTGDDCIAINSGMNEDGWRVGRPCENVEIRNCTMNGGHGGIVIGSAISGGVKNIYAHDCKINGTMQGIRLKSMRGRGGCVDHAVFENIEINNVSHQAVQINMFYEFSTVMPKSDEPSDFKNITIKHVYGKNANVGIEIKGLPEHKLSDITLEHIHLSAEHAFTCSNVEKISMTDVEIDSIGKDDNNDSII